MSAASSVCWAEEAGMSAVRAEIDHLAARFSEAYARGDAKAMSAFYTDDAIAFPPGNEMVKGRQAIQEMWQSAIDTTRVS